jgi:LysM repeat protein
LGLGFKSGKEETMEPDLAKICKWQDGGINYRRSQWFKALTCSKVSICAAALALFAVLFTLSGCSDDESIQKLASLDARLERVEAKLAKMEEKMERMVLLEGRVKELQKSISELKTPETPNTVKSRYHEVRQGDNLSVIAQEYGMTVQELCRLNGITPQTIIRPGQMLLIIPEG